VTPLALLLLVVGSVGAGAAQVLPPIYKPLPLEEGDRFRAAADSLRSVAAEAVTQAIALEEGAQTLRQNGSGVAEKLLAEAQRLNEQVNRLDTRVRVDGRTIEALQAQRADFQQRAIRHESVMFEARAASEAVRLGDLDDTSGGESIDPAVEARIRSDSLLAVTYREQAEELSAQADELASTIAANRLRIISLQDQETQLRSYAAEIASGRVASEPTAARLALEAAALRAHADRLVQDARAQTELAEELRVQANRRLIPVRSRVEAMRFYGEDGRAVLRTLVFSLGEGGRSGSINSEIVSDYAGPFRFGVGFVLAEANESADGGEAEGEAPADGAALERFYAGGGNFVVYSALPLLFHRSAYHSLTVQTLNKVAFDVPGAKNRADARQIPANLDIGVEAYGTFNTYGGSIKAFGLMRSGVAIGNEPFTQNLGRRGRTFGYAQLTMGAEVASVAKILLSGARAPGDLGREVSLTFQVGR
jgi:hypothetical protein